MKVCIHRSAFTMIELLFVIVIMGIVGGFALDTLRQYYENIYRSHEYSKRVADADHALEQISHYFESALNSSIVNLDRGSGTGCFGTPVAGDANDYTVAFVAADSDSLRGSNGQPGWNEDTVLLPNNRINAADVNYTVANSIITKLAPPSATPAYTLLNSAIYDTDSKDVDACTRFNWNGGGTQGYHAISAMDDTNLTLDPANVASNGKEKYLLRSGYAFRVLNNGDFMMYSNFRPWRGEAYTTALNQNLIARDVAFFTVSYNAQDYQNNPNLNDRGMIWKLHVCMRGVADDLSDSSTSNQDICRERSIHVRY